MINDFIYDIPVRIYFGRDQLKHLGAELKKYGTRVLMTYGGGSIKKMGLYDRVVKELNHSGLQVQRFLRYHGNEISYSNIHESSPLGRSR